MVWGEEYPMIFSGNPATNDYKTVSTWYEYGLPYNSTAGGVTKENPLWWQVEWPTAKNYGSRDLAYKVLRRAVKKGDVG